MATTPVTLNFQDRDAGSGVRGSVTFRPYYLTDDAPNPVIALYRDAATSVELEAGIPWVADESINGIPADRLIIPDPLVPAYANLPDIDPDSLGPIAVPEAVWDIALTAESASRVADVADLQAQLDARPPLPGFQPRTGEFDAATGVYTPAGSRGLPKFAAALAKVRSGSTTARATIGLCGHSLLAGYTTSVGTYDPASQLRKEFAQTYGVKVGTGIVPTFNGNAVGFTDDSRYTKTGTFQWLGSAGNLVPWTYGSAGPPSITFTSTTSGTVVDVIVADNFGNATYQIDGGAVVPIVVGGTSSFKTTTVTGLADSTHIVKVTSPGSSLVPLGVNVRYPSDVEVHNFGLVGTAAGDWIATTSWSTSLGVLVGLAPSVVVIMLGAAEIQAGTSAATYKANLQTMITAYVAAGSDVLLVGATPMQGYSDAQWLPYREALLDLADANDCLLVDPYPFLVSYASAVALGLLNGVDIVHFTNAGNQEVMRLVAGAIGR